MKVKSPSFVGSSMILKSGTRSPGGRHRVTNKGFNCANNIINALKKWDGYLFSKSAGGTKEK
jgi:hypothetical protein